MIRKLSDFKQWMKRLKDSHISFNYHDRSEDCVCGASVHLNKSDGFRGCRTAERKVIGCGFLVNHLFFPAHKESMISTPNRNSAVHILK
jgi:hypothetical protein